MALRGTLVVLTFSDAGDIEHAFALSQNSETIGVEVSTDVWHTAVSLAEGSVFMEVKPGPFQPLSDRDKAPWAPAEGSAEAVDYNARLSARVRSLCAI